MIAYYINGERATYAEAVEQNRINALAWAQVESGNMAAGLQIKLICAYDRAAGALVPREKWTNEQEAAR